MVEKSGDKVQRMFAQIAPHYDRMNHLLSLNIDKRWRAKTVARLGAFATDSLLDVCTGTGDLATAFVQKTKCQKVIGTDFCTPMLDIARQKQHRFEISQDRLTFMEADAQALPFQSDSFSVVTVAFGLRNVADTMLGLKEMLRVCKSGGRVGILEFSKPRLPVLRQLYSAYFKYVLPKVGQRLARNDSSAYEYLPASVSEFPSGRALLQLMQQAGYVDVAEYPMTFGVATLYVGQKS